MLRFNSICKWLSPEYLKLLTQSLVQLGTIRCCQILCTIVVELKVLSLSSIRLELKSVDPHQIILALEIFILTKIIVQLEIIDPELIIILNSK